MTPKRRTYDKTDACELAHFAHERLDEFKAEIQPAIRQLVRHQWMSTGFIACLYFLSKFDGFMQFLVSAAQAATK